MKTYNIILRGIDAIDFPRHVSRSQSSSIEQLLFTLDLSLCHCRYRRTPLSSSSACVVKRQRKCKLPPCNHSRVTHVTFCILPPLLHCATASLVLVCWTGLCVSLRFSERLGYIGGGIGEIKSNRWFDGFHWEGLERRTMPAPYVPAINGPLDSANFDPYPPEEPDFSTFDASYDSGWDDGF